MVTIHVTKELCNRAEVRGASSEVIKLVDEACCFEAADSFWSRRARNFRGDGKRHLFSKLTNRFPVGLVSLVRETLDKAKVPHRVVDERVFGLPKKVRADLLSGITLADHQIQAVRSLFHKRGGILHLATNAGKTACACAVLKCLPSKKVLWVVPSKTLVKQTIREIQIKAGIQAGQISGGVFDPQHVTVACAPSLLVKGDKKDLVVKLKKQRMKEFMQSVGVMILDEVHHSGSTQWNRPLTSCHAPWRIGMSGTPLDRSDGKNMLVESICGPVVARVTSKQLVQLGWSAQPTIEVHEVDKPPLPENLSWQEAYKLGIVHNNFRNNLIAKRTIQAINDDQGVLILCREIEHVSVIGDFLRTHGVGDGEFVQVWAGCPDQEERVGRFKTGQAKVMVASPVFGEGVDLPGDNVRVLINAEGLMSVILTLQKLGRSLRRKKTGSNSVRVVEFADMTNRHLAKHSLKRIDTYEAEGFQVIGV